MNYYNEVSRAVEVDCEQSSFYTESELYLLSAHSKSYGFSFRHRNFNMWTKIAFLGIAMISTINGNYNYVKFTRLYVLQILIIINI